MRVIFLFIAVVLSLTSFADYSNADYSNLEPFIQNYHDQEFFIKLNSFLDQGRLSETRLSESLKSLENNLFVLSRAQANGQYRNDIEFRGSDKVSPDYDKIPNDEGTALASVAIDLNKNLIGMSQKWTSLHEAEKKQALNLLADFIIIRSAVTGTQVKDTVLTLPLRQLYNFFSFYPKIKKNDQRLKPASNISFLENQGHNTNEADLSNLNPSDSSSLNPPDSAFWSNNNVKDYNPLEEKFLNSELFPPANEDVEFDFDEMGTGNPKIKAQVKYQNKSYKLNIRSGKEVHAQVLTGHLARAVGYPAIPSVFRKKITLKLKNTSIDQFFALWKKAHTDRSSFTNNIFGRVKIIDPQTLELTDVALEAYPNKDLYIKGAPFRAGRNGFSNRREYRALLFYAALINWSDAGEQNIRMDLKRESKNDFFKPVVFLNDTGISLGSNLGLRNGAAVNEYSSKMADLNDHEISLRYIALHHRPKAWAQTSFDDLKWIAGRYAQLSNLQINQMIQVSGLPEPVASLYKFKIKSRLLQLINYFNLSTDLSIDEYLIDIHQKYPKWVSKMGQLKDQFDIDYNGQTRYNGERQQLKEIFSMTLVNQVFKIIADIINTPVVPLKVPESLLSQKISGLQTRSVQTGIRFSCYRKVGVNPRQGQGQLRYLRQDTCEFSLPLGFTETRRRVDMVNLEKSKKISVELPIGLYANYTLKLLSSFASESEAATFNTENKDLLRMFNLLFQKQNQQIQVGQTFEVESSYGFSFGAISFYPSESFYFEVNPFKKSWQKINEFKVRRISSNLIEVDQAEFDLSTSKKGFDIEAFDFGFSALITKEVSKPKRYFGRFNAEKFTGQTLLKLLSPFDFRPLVDSSIASQAEFFSKIEGSQYSKKNQWGAFVFKTETTKQNSELTIITQQSNEDSFAEFNEFEIEDDQIDQDLNEKSSKFDEQFVKLNEDQLYTSSWSKRKSRSFKNLWTQLDSPSVVENILNLPLTPLVYLAKVKQKEIYVELLKNKNNELNFFAELSYVKKDNFINSSELQNDYINSAQKVSGEPQYFDFYKPDPQVSRYSPIELNMNLTIGHQGLLKILDEVMKKPETQSSSQLANEIKVNLKSAQLMKAAKKMRNLLLILSRNGKNWSNILNYLKMSQAQPLDSQKYYQLDTFIAFALEPTVSAVFGQQHHLSPEIKGQFQGRRYFDQRGYNFIESFNY